MILISDSFRNALHAFRKALSQDKRIIARIQRGGTNDYRTEKRPRSQSTQTVKKGLPGSGYVGGEAGEISRPNDKPQNISNAGTA